MTRRPVPRAWREANHFLRQKTRYYAGGGYAGTRVYRSGGTCSCGATFGLDADQHNFDAEDVREAYKDHVEDAFYELDSSTANL